MIIHQFYLSWDHRFSPLFLAIWIISWVFLFALHLAKNNQNNTHKLYNKKQFYHLTTFPTTQILVEKFFLTTPLKIHCSKILPCVKEINFTDKGENYTFEERVKALTLDDFEKLFKANNLKIVHLFVVYKINDFDSKQSGRLIIVGEKIK